MPVKSWDGFIYIAPKIARGKCKTFLDAKKIMKFHCLISRWFFHVPAIYRQVGRSLQEHLREGTKSRSTKPRVQICIYKCDYGDSTGLHGVQQPRFSSESAFAQDSCQSKTQEEGDNTQG